MKDTNDKNDARISLFVPHRLKDAAKLGAKNIPGLSLNDYCKLALCDRLKTDGVAMDAA
jgi:hypothetical protein